MANNDVAIPIVFPDYLIMVETPTVDIKIPDLLPRVDILPDRLKVPAAKWKIPYLGHAGILFIQGSSGLTKYYEYGRYPPGVQGRVRKTTLSDVTIGGNGRPTKKSLEIVLTEVSMKSGHGGKIRGAYVELAPGAFIHMLAYAARRMQNNSNPRRAPYDIVSNSCLHFMKEVAEAGGARMPAVIAPQPAGYIVQVRLRENDLDFQPPGPLTVQDLELE
jgi:hypothetical protein